MNEQRSFLEDEGVEAMPAFDPPPMNGEELKELGISRVSAADPVEAAKVDMALLKLARSGQIFTAEDVRALAGSPVRPNLMGSRFHVARKLGLIETCGATTSKRRSRHGATIWRWRGSRDMRKHVSLKEAELARERNQELVAVQKILDACAEFNEEQKLRIVGFAVEQLGIGPIAVAYKAKAKEDEKAKGKPDAEEERRRAHLESVPTDDLP